jgi:hypothetical protein
MFLQISNPIASLANSNSGGIDFLLTGLFKDDALNFVITSICGQVSILALGLALFLFLLMTGYNFVKNSIDSLTGTENDGKIVDIAEIVRVLIIIIMISLYTAALMPTINGLVMTINSLTTPSAEQAQVYQKAAEKYYADMQVSQEQKNIAKLNKTINDPNSTKEEVAAAKQAISEIQSGGSVLDKIGNLAKGIYTAITGAVTQLCVTALTFVSAIIKLIVGVLALLIFKTLLCLGPLALAVSVIPAYKGQADVWFGTTIGAGLALTTMHILDHIFFAMIGTTMAVIGTNADFGVGSMLVLTTLSIVIIVLYLMTFWLTSKWVGKGDAGRVITKMVALATEMATLSKITQAPAAGKSLGNATNSFAQSQQPGKE